uniref:T-complex protein 11-like protein 2 n=1 Tax=Salarias fasciatus TaxID=181472 RepID=A0A672I6Z1_SALFA
MPLNDERPSSSPGANETSAGDASAGDASASDASASDASASESSSSSCSPSSSPPRAVTLDQVMDSTRDLLNLHLSHHILADRHFRVPEEPLPEGSLWKTVRDNLHKAFWDILEAELNDDPPQYGQAISLLQEIREALLSLLEPSGGQMRSLQDQILEVLDLDLIRQQAQHGAVDIPGLAVFIVDAMGQLCAPARDPEIRKLRERAGASDAVALFREIFRVLDMMKVDLINFSIMDLRRVLQQHGAAYERDKFQKVLERTPSALDRTTAWIRSAMEELLPSGWGSDGVKGQVALPGPAQILNTAYLQLLRWDYSRNPLPETLVTEERRLQDLQRRLQQNRAVCQVLLLVSSGAGDAVRDLPALTERLKRMVAVLLDGMHRTSFDLDEALKGVGAKVCCELNDSLRGRGHPALSPAQQDTLRGQICSLAQPENPVRTLVEDRVQQYFQTLVFSSEPRVKLQEVPSGLADIGAELAALGAAFLPLVSYNKAVYTPFYMSVIRKLLFSQEPPHGTPSTGVPVNSSVQSL